MKITIYYKVTNKEESIFENEDIGIDYRGNFLVITQNQFRKNGPVTNQTVIPLEEIFRIEAR